ncbi:Putative glycosyltransferase EpsD [Stieleria neptunia]|uniref:Glycosyltransferase EpsD n=1 Tax=Stieleria neptunia TaxID=2527979 RepID=A0A518HN85_9BACT|nr:glycosyltransferase family 4 protein [Stieleria neptunia]QDV42303.1 Putative glycosyltransferase EpsD [Stieleria neptunia]
MHTTTTRTSQHRSEGEPSIGSVPVVAFCIYHGPHQANGGLESITQILTRFRRIRPVVLTDRESDFSARWRKAGIEVIRFGGRQRQAKGIWRAGGLVAETRDFFRWIKRCDADVVHCNDIQSLRQVAFATRLAGKKLVFNLRNLKPPGQRYGWKWRVVDLVDEIIVLSDEMGDGVKARLLRGHERRKPLVRSIYSIVPSSPGGVAPSRELRHELGIREDEFAIGYVGAFNQRKQQLPFLETGAPAILGRVPHAKFYFLGDFAPSADDYAASCLHAAERIGGNAVRFVGFASDVATWYNAFDLVIVGSANEGLARCMIESLSTGTPVVSFDVCSAREILETHRCGRVVAQSDYDAMADAVAELSDETHRREVAERAIDTARDLFEATTIIRQYEDVYLGLLSKR